MYLLAITFGLCIAYFILLFAFPFFFEKKGAKVQKKSFRSVAAIVLASLAGYGVALSIPNPELGNRILHGFGGGFMAFLVCFLAVKDSNMALGRFQFFVFSALVVTALGVANELLKLFLQEYLGLVFAKTPTDTGLDLLSNTIGILVAAVCLVSFIRRTNRSA